MTTKTLTLTPFELIRRSCDKTQPAYRATLSFILSCVSVHLMKVSLILLSLFSSFKLIPTQTLLLPMTAYRSVYKAVVL